MAEGNIDRGSFRDPAGQVHLIGDRVFRTVMPMAAADYEAVRNRPTWRKLIDSGRVLPEQEVEPTVLGEAASEAVHVLEHPRLPHVSYPYEWSFPLLKAAALAHLELHMEALEGDINLIDATAYNIQFQGPKPVFIDHLSFRPYHDGEFWTGHKQFCEQFLNPLLLRAFLGITHNAWYRGALEGIPVEELNRLLPWRRKLSWKVLSHVTLQARLQQAAVEKGGKAEVKQRKLPKPAFIHMLRSLHGWISSLEPADTGKTVWGDYARNHSYTDDEVAAKKAFVAEAVRGFQPETLWDIGCNTGDYSKVALEAGARRVIGFDFDQRALELAYARAVDEKLDFLPLFLDAANPSPDQGWAQAERKGLAARRNADAIIALAVIHHLAIGRNVPLSEVVDWLVDMAPTGVIEFVPKQDPMVQALLRLREDIFPDYTEAAFLAHLRERAEVVDSRTVSASGRLLVAYRRQD